MAKRSSTNRLPLLKCLLGILFIGISVAGSTAVGKQCEVMDVHVTSHNKTSTFEYNITYKDPSCTNKGKLEHKLTGCNGSSTLIEELTGEGKVHTCSDGGMKMVTVGNVNSPCFYIYGLTMAIKIPLVFDYENLNITINFVHPALESWNLMIYKSTRSCFPCTTQQSKGEIERAFDETNLQPQITRSKITLRHAFDKDACYCFVLSPISKLNLGPDNIPFTTHTCKPDPVSAEYGNSTSDMRMSRSEMVQWCILVATVILVWMMIYVAFRNPVFLSQILGLKQRIVGDASSSRKLVLSPNSEVLLLYTPDMSGCKDLAQLKKNLQAAFKVYDLFDHYDRNRLADSCGWTERMLLPSSGVKILLVESVGLLNKMKSLLKSEPENSGLAKATEKSLLDKSAESLLTFILKTILGSDLRVDYSTVFVVRFSDEVRDVVDLVVKMRRYKFPDHFSELSVDLKSAQSCNVKKEVV